MDSAADFGLNLLIHGDSCRSSNSIRLRLKVAGSNPAGPANISSSYTGGSVETILYR